MSSSAPAPAGFARRPRTYFDLVVAAYCVVLVLSNVAATKGVAFGPVITDGGFFLFPLAYVLGDVVAEVYGFRAARRAIVTSFAAGLFSSVVFWLVIALVVTPGATAYLLTDRFPRLLALAVAIGAGTSALGAYLSYFLDGATGGIIVLLQTALFVAAFVLAPTHGLLAARARARAALGKESETARH